MLSPTPLKTIIIGSLALSMLLIAVELEKLSLYLEQIAAAASEPKQQSPWPSLFLQKELVTKREEMQKLYSDDCIRLSSNNAAAVRPASPSTFRVATFNVLSFQGVLAGQASSKSIIQRITEEILTEVAPDIIVFEEVGFAGTKLSWTPGLRSPIFAFLEKAGYKVPSNLLNAAITNFNVPSPCMVCVKKDLKVKFSSTTYDTNYSHNRGYVRVEIAPSPATKDTRIIFYGTHLDIYDETEKTRQAQITQLLEVAKKDIAPDTLVIIAGDLNAINPEEYADNKDMLDRLRQQRTAYLTETKRADPNIYATPPHAVFDAIKAAGFIDVFSFAQSPSPRWTTWAGTRVDWILLPAETKNLKVHPGVFYPVSKDGTILSDHILVFADLEFQ